MKLSLKHFYKQVSLITYSFIASQIVLLGIAIILNPGSSNKAIEELLQWLVPVVTFGAIIMSNSIYNFRVKEIQSLDEKLEEKQKQYLSATIIRLALLTGPSFLALISFLFTFNHVFLAFNGLIIVIMILQKPSEVQINLDLFQKIFTIEETKTNNAEKISYVSHLAEELKLNTNIQEEKKKKILDKHLLQEVH